MVWDAIFSKLLLFVSSVGTATLVGAGWAAYTFLKERREDRRWKQVEFILDLNQKFFCNADIKDCIRSLDNTHDLDALKHIFETERASLSGAEIQTLEKFRGLFQFFDSLSRCFKMKAITLDHVNIFGWFLYRINETDFIRNYCFDNGFSNVIFLANALEKYTYSSKNNSR